jgi:hypothetical protein
MIRGPDLNTPQELERHAQRARCREQQRHGAVACSAALSAYPVHTNVVLSQATLRNANAAVRRDHVGVGALFSFFPFRLYESPPFSNILLGL